MKPGPDRLQGRRVLFVAPNWLGDVLMCLPLLDWLAAARAREDVPRFTLTVAVRDAWAPLLAGDPRVDGLMATERPGRHGGWRGVLRQAAQWRGGRFDAVLLGPPSLRAAVVAGLAGVPQRIGHATDLRGPLLTRPLARKPRGSLHFSREMIELGYALAEAERWPSAAVAAAEAAPAAWLANGRDGVRRHAGERPLWALGAGATFGPAKTWPVSRAAEFLRAVVAGRGGRVLVLGDAASASLVAALRAATGELAWSRGGDAVGGATAADVIDLTGLTDIPGVVGWLRECEAYVGNDSGLMHLAAALGTPTVGLFGSTNPAWTRPLGPRVAAVAAEGFACSPCYRRSCNQDSFCLDAVGGRDVYAAAMALIGAPGGASPAGREGDS